MEFVRKVKIRMIHMGALVCRAAAQAIKAITGSTGKQVSEPFAI